MRDQAELAVGGTGWLRPTTKLASRECHARLACVIVSYDEWPLVWVRVFDVVGMDEGHEIRVHRDNIGIRPRPKRDVAGDTNTGSQDGAERMVGKPIARPVARLTGAVEEPMLW